MAKKPAKKIAAKDAQCMLRLPPGLRDKVAARAAQNNRSMNTEIIEAIEHHLQGADRITRLWEFFEQHRENIESVPLLRTAIENVEIFAERSVEFSGGLRALRPHREAAQPSVTGEPAERLKAAIEAMRTHSRDFEERIRATKSEEQKEPPDVSDRRAPRRLRDLGRRLLRQFRRRGGDFVRGFSPGSNSPTNASSTMWRSLPGPRAQSQVRGQMPALLSFTFLDLKCGSASSRAVPPV